MFKKLKKQIRSEGYRVYRTTGELRCTLTFKIVDPDLPIKSIKKFLDELEDNYWLNFEEFECSHLPVENPTCFDIDFNRYSFSALTKMYLIIMNNNMRLKIACSNELLDAIIGTISFRIKHVPRGIKKKVMKVLNDPIFFNLDYIIATTKLSPDTWKRIL